jgi:hypothetical protein
VSEGADSRAIGRAPFADGVTREVYEDADGRQWVAGYEGERVYGVWVMPPDEPVVVSTER